MTISPRPWTFLPESLSNQQAYGEIGEIRDSGGFRVAELINDSASADIERDNAHAKLMALAPELAASMDELLDWAWDANEWRDGNGKKVTEWRAVRDRAMALRETLRTLEGVRT